MSSERIPATWQTSEKWRCISWHFHCSAQAADATDRLTANALLLTSKSSNPFQKEKDDRLLHCANRRRVRQLDIFVYSFLLVTALKSHKRVILKYLSAHHFILFIWFFFFFSPKKKCKTFFCGCNDILSGHERQNLVQKEDKSRRGINCRYGSTETLQK